MRRRLRSHLRPRQQLPDLRRMPMASAPWLGTRRLLSASAMPFRLVIPGCRIEPARAVPSVAHYTTTFWTSLPTILFACADGVFTGSLRSEEKSVVREYRAESEQNCSLRSGHTHLGPLRGGTISPAPMGTNHGELH
jgi:hypothetical protein